MRTSALDEGLVGAEIGVESIGLLVYTFNGLKNVDISSA